MDRAIIIGSGASLQEGIDKKLWDRISRQDIWSCNSIFKIMPYVPAKEIWVDRDFTKHEHSSFFDLAEKGVELITRDQGFLLGHIQPFTTIYECTRSIEEAQKDEKLILRGSMGLCGMFALHVAIKRKYDEVYLLGFDFGTTNFDDRRTHVFQNKIQELNILASGAGRPEVYLDKTTKKPFRFVDEWDYLKDKGSKIYNVSVNSNIKAFDKLTYDEFFERLKV